MVYDARTSVTTDAARNDAATHALVQLCTDATAVQEVIIHASQTLRSMQTVEEMASAVTAQLAASALQLHTVKSPLRELSSFPYMPTLKHLILQVRRSTLQGGIDALLALQLLESLQIIGEDWRGLELTLSDHFDCPVLDLTPLRCLRSFSLRRLTPQSILVCPDCFVDVGLCGPADHRVWGNLSGLHSLRSVHWTNPDFFILLSAPEALPKVIHEPWQLQWVSLNSDEWELDSLLAPLARVPVLHIKGYRIELRVPAFVSWQEFVVRSKGKLVVTFEDLHAFAQTPISFRIDCTRGYRKLGQEWLP